MKPTIKTTWRELEQRTGRAGVDHIAIAHLGKYGFDDAIINAMVQYEIFPQTYCVCGEYYVARADIFGNVVNKLLANSMAIYKAVAEKDAVAAEVKAAASELYFDEATMTKLQTGEWTMDDARAYAATKRAELEAELDAAPANAEEPTCSE